MTPRHLHSRRPREDRDVTWCRHCHSDGTIVWIFWRRDHRRALHCERVIAAGGAIPFDIGQRLRKAKRKLRDFVDEIDLKAMEETA